MAINMLEGVCPYCGKLLQIPEDLKEFSCLYCGKRMNQEELLHPSEEFAAETALSYVKEHIMECLEDGKTLREVIQKDLFMETFAQYEQKHQKTFFCLDEACRSHPEQRQQLMQTMVEDFLDQLDQRWQGTQKAFQESDKVTVAIYMVPAIRHMKLSCSEEFCSLLHTAWMKRYPDNPFVVGDYEALVAGFKKKILGMCFITTAVCEQEGKPDDCEELTAFRRFRDGYLRTCSDGDALIAEYYEIAPAIVTVIGVCDDPVRAYGEIRNRWLQACYHDLQQGNMEGCKIRYTEMVRTLEQKYLS